MRSQFLSDRPAQNSTPSGAPDAMLGAESLEKRLKSSDADEDAGTGGSVDVADVVSSGAGSLGLGKADADKAGAAVASLVVPTEQQKGNFPTVDDDNIDSGFSYKRDNEDLKMVDLSIAGSAAGARFWTRDGDVTRLGSVIVAAAVGSGKSKIVSQGQLLPLFVKGGNLDDVAVFVLQQSSNHVTSVVVWNPKVEGYRQLPLKGLGTLAAAAKESTPVFYSFESQLQAEMVINGGMDFVKGHHQPPVTAVAPLPAPVRRETSVLPESSAAVKTLESYSVDGKDMFQLMLQKEHLETLVLLIKDLAVEVKHVATSVEKLEEQVS